MDWLCLGHAMWLAQAAGLRILFDPLLGADHHGGVFEVTPRRTIDARALRADFVFVSHRHPDHFDVPSLARLIALDPDSVIVTPDGLVAWAARALGARTVEVVPPGQRVALDGVTIVTTPSLAPDEWGALVANAEGAVWNQVDTVLAGPAAVRDVIAGGLAAVGADALALALVRWQPMLEVAAQLGQRTGFPLQDYAALLAEAVATGARAVVPAAAGEAYTARWAAMNRVVFPASEARFLRDLAALAPGVRGLGCRVGAGYRVRGGEVSLEPGAGAGVVEVEEAVDPRVFAPNELPPVCDPGLGWGDEGRMRAEVEAWVRGPLARGLARACGEAGGCFVLELRFVAATDVYTLTIAGGEATVRRGFDDAWDGLNVVAGSMTWEVITGRRHWGDVLLSGALRASSRAYEVVGGGLRSRGLGEVFLYHGLSYDASVERAVRAEVAAIRGA